LGPRLTHNAMDTMDRPFAMTPVAYRL